MNSLIALAALLYHCINAQTAYLVINDIHLNINTTSYEIPMPGEETTVSLLNKILEQA